MERGRRPEEAQRTHEVVAVTQGNRHHRRRRVYPDQRTEPARRAGALTGPSAARRGWPPGVVREHLDGSVGHEVRQLADVERIRGHRRHLGEDVGALATDLVHQATRPRSLALGDTATSEYGRSLSAAIRHHGPLSPHKVVSDDSRDPGAVHAAIGAGGTLDTGHLDEDGSQDPCSTVSSDRRRRHRTDVSHRQGRRHARGAGHDRAGTGARPHPRRERSARRAPATIERLATAWRTRRLQRFDLDRADGHYEVFVTPMAEAEGRVPRLLVHVFDRHRHRDRCRNLVNAAIVDGLPVGRVVDGDGVIRAVNAGWVRFGLERSSDGVLADAGTKSTSASPIVRRGRPDRGRRRRHAIRSVLAGHVEIATAEYPSDDAGESEWFTMRAAAVDVDGERWAVVAHEDVTTLRLAIHRWHSTFSNVAVPTFLVDPSGTILDAYSVLAALLRVDTTTAIGHPAAESCTPRIAPSLATLLRPGCHRRRHVA